MRENPVAESPLNHEAENYPDRLRLGVADLLVGRGKSRGGGRSDSANSESLAHRSSGGGARRGWHVGVHGTGICSPRRECRPQRGEAARTARDEVLARYGSDLTRAVRLCAYVADDRSVAKVEAAVARRFAARPVAFTLVRTPLTQAGARVAFEAVAVSATKGSVVEVTRSGAAIMPAGGRIFISGQAPKGPTCGRRCG